MKTVKDEKEWLRRMQKEATAHEERKTAQKSVKERHTPKGVRKSGDGFKSVAGMEQLKQMVTEAFINVLKNSECADAYGIMPPSLLFYGPAGCGKTFFAERIADELGINFIKVVPDDLASTLVHGTQEKIGELFRKAEAKAPTLVFFDEFDAMVPRRTADDKNYQNGETNEFLCMLNNAAERGVYVIAATNHPERIDKAILRSGRIDEMIYVDMPDHKARESQFRLALSKLPVEENVDYSRLAELTKGYNCSDISYIIKLASRKKFNESIMDVESKSFKPITQALLEEVIASKSPSVSSRDLRSLSECAWSFRQRMRDVSAWL